ncbi:hypothetical protein FRB98_006597 [Tulasnella sp. 332]|nr:hypothetical protein FRB98_006597 [Tulasnella sp. 332]
MEDPTTVAAESKYNGIMGLLRRATSSVKPTSTPVAGANATGEPSSTQSEVHGEYLTSASPTTEAPVAPSSSTGVEIEAKDITPAKTKTTVMQKLMRLTSKDGKSRVDNKETAQPTAEASQAIEEETEEASEIPPLVLNPKLKAALDTAPGANTLSRRIQVMLSNAPPFLQTVSDDSQIPAPTPKPKPAPPSGLSDAQLLGYLSNASVMNNKHASKAEGKTQKSVWQVLDQLVPYEPPVMTIKEGEVSTEVAAAGSSLMITGPLVPNENSVVMEVEALADVPGVSKNVAKGVFLSLFPDKLRIPFLKTKATVLSSPSSSTPQPTTTTQVKVWIPSETELSFQVAWWGFRLWLPPPVMATLSDDALSVEKKAAMVQSAIAWIINNIPLALIPPAIQPAIVLLKAAVPYLSYIGGFIAWSWSEVKSFDKGRGVVLSATWLLPIALIPSSWEITTPAAPAPTPPAPTPPAPTVPSTGTAPAVSPAEEEKPSVSVPV